jgi:hypothetical protein
VQTVRVPQSEDRPGAALWDESPPPRFEDQDLDLLALQLWRRASPDAPSDDWLTDEEALRCHASCL